MKNALKIIALLVVAAFCIGWEPSYDVEYVTVKAGSGVTVWRIAGAFYDENKLHPLKTMCFDDYYTKVMQCNKALFANGRVLQPGDDVVIPIYKVK